MNGNEEFVKQARAIGLDMAFLTNFAAALIEVKRCAGLNCALSLSAAENKALLQGLRLLQSGLKR